MAACSVSPLAGIVRVQGLHLGRFFFRDPKANSHRISMGEYSQIGSILIPFALTLRLTPKSIVFESKQDKQWQTGRSNAMTRLLAP